MSASAAIEADRPERFALPRDRFIVSPAFDALFFIGSPLLAIAAIHAAWQVFPAPAIESGVLLYLAVGHHVPTFLRAYGDPDEFRQNRFRLLVIPVLVLPLVALAFAVDARLLGLVFIWDQYHFVRQHYGFMRIYDAKRGILSALTARLDQWLCFSWFIAIIANSDFYGFVYSSAFFDLGLNLPGWLGPLLRRGSLWAAALVSVAYAVHLLRQLGSSQPVSPLKLAITATTYGTWYYAYVALGNPILSYPISSFFHCLQYDALAWHYSRQKAKNLAPGTGSLIFRYMYERRRVWLYVAAIGSYGLFSQLGSAVAPGAIFVLNRTTGLLHYYFDSFIWRVRKAEFRKHL